MTKTDEELVAAARAMADHADRWHRYEMRGPIPEPLLFKDQRDLLAALADRLEARGGVPVAWRWRQLHREIDGPITGWFYGDHKPSFSSNHRWEVEPLYAPAPPSPEDKG